MGGVCSSLCGNNRSYYSTISAHKGPHRPLYGEQELMDDVEFENLLRMNPKVSDDADLLMGVADADLGRSPHKTEWERNPRVLSAEEIHTITRQKIEEIVRQQAIKDKELDQQFTSEEIKAKEEEEAAIEARRLAAKAVKDSSKLNNPTSQLPSSQPSTPVKSKIVRTDSDPNMMSPDMRKWLNDDSDAAVLTKFSTGNNGNNNNSNNNNINNNTESAANALIANANSRAPPSTQFTEDPSDDFDTFLDSVKAKTFSATTSSTTTPGAATVATTVDSSLPSEPVVSSSNYYNSTASAISPPPPPLPSTNDSNEETHDNLWNVGLSPELLQAMQATQNVDSAFET